MFFINSTTLSDKGVSSRGGSNVSVLDYSGCAHNDYSSAHNNTHFRWYAGKGASCVVHGHKACNAWKLLNLSAVEAGCRGDFAPDSEKNERERIYLFTQADPP
jgi:hypothetical protein